MDKCFKIIFVIIQIRTIHQTSERDIFLPIFACSNGRQVLRRRHVTNATSNYRKGNDLGNEDGKEGDLGK